MRSLIDIAKEMGFEPNPNLTKEDWIFLVDSLRTYFLHKDSGLTDQHPLEQYRRNKFNDLSGLIYASNCIIKRSGFDEWAEKNIELLKSRNIKGIFPAPQNIPGDLKTTNYIWHYPKTMNNDPLRERFTVDINMTSRQFPEMLKKLDQFIIKYQSRFKMANTHNRHRIDTLNVYMTKDITPEIARELYDIVEPCLKRHNHHRLNGRDIYAGNKRLEGIKIGPVLNGEESFYIERANQAQKWIERDFQNPELKQYAEKYVRNWIGTEPHFDKEKQTMVSSVQPSLGEVTTSIELMNLMYYMTGKEKQNPFQLTGYDNKPYEKNISFEPIIKQEERAIPNSFFKRLTAIFHKEEVKTPVVEAKVSEPDWKDADLWSGVQIQRPEGIYYGHRINVSKFSEAERQKIKEKLEKLNIKFTERRATTKNADINPGDLTIRITDPESVKQLRSMVFHWAEDTHRRPTFKPTTEYEAGERQIQEKRSVRPVETPSVTARPAWAKKDKWTPISTTDIITGKKERGYVMDAGDPNNLFIKQPNKLSEASCEDVIETLRKKGIQAEIGRGFNNRLPPHALKHRSIVIMGNENAERFEKMFLGKDTTLQNMERGNSGR